MEFFQPLEDLTSAMLARIVWSWFCDTGSDCTGEGSGAALAGAAGSPSSAAQDKGFAEDSLKRILQSTGKSAEACAMR